MAGNPLIPDNEKLSDRPVIPVPQRHPRVRVGLGPSPDLSTRPIGRPARSAGPPLIADALLVADPVAGSPTRADRSVLVTSIVDEAGRATSIGGASAVYPNGAGTIS